MQSKPQRVNTTVVPKGSFDASRQEMPNKSNIETSELVSQSKARRAIGAQTQLGKNRKSGEIVQTVNESQVQGRILEKLPINNQTSQVFKRFFKRQKQMHSFITKSKQNTGKEPLNKSLNERSISRWRQSKAKNKDHSNIYSIATNILEKSRALSLGPTKHAILRTKSIEKDGAAEVKKSLDRKHYPFLLSNLFDQTVYNKRGNSHKRKSLHEETKHILEARKNSADIHAKKAAAVSDGIETKRSQPTKPPLTDIYGTSKRVNVTPTKVKNSNMALKRAVQVEAPAVKITNRLGASHAVQTLAVFQEDRISNSEHQLSSRGHSRRNSSTAQQIFNQVPTNDNKGERRTAKTVYTHQMQVSGQTVPSVIPAATEMNPLSQTNSKRNAKRNEISTNQELKMNVGTTDYKIELLSESDRDDTPERGDRQEHNERRLEPVSRRSEGFRIWNQLVLARGPVTGENKNEAEMSAPGTPELGSIQKVTTFTKEEDNAYQPSYNPSERNIWYRNQVLELSGLHDEIIKVDNIAERPYDLPKNILSPEQLQLQLEQIKNLKSRLLAKSVVLGPIVSSEKLLPKFEIPKSHRCQVGPIKGFAANSHCGIKRVINEDRISISLNPGFVSRHSTLTLGSRNRPCGLSIFSVFDGHGGTLAADFLKDKFSQAVGQSIDLSGISSKSIRSAFDTLDKEVCELAVLQKNYQTGSCATSLLVIDDTLIIAHSGDSRCIASQQQGAVLRALTTDHKPENISEFSRIIENGGKIERESSHIATKNSEFHFATKFAHIKSINKMKQLSPDRLYSPWRILPGGLTVSRSLGDASSKIAEFGGRQGLVISEPDILDFEAEDFDFILIACELIS